MILLPLEGKLLDVTLHFSCDHEEYIQSISTREIVKSYPRACCSKHFFFFLYCEIEIGTKVRTFFRACLHFDEHEHAVLRIKRDDVDLIVTEPHVSLPDFVSTNEKITDRDIFSVTPGLDMRR